MDHLAQLADPSGTGTVSLEALKDLPCWRTREEEDREIEHQQRVVALEQLSSEEGGSPGRRLSSQDESPTPGPGEQLVVYVTIPEGVAAGDTLRVVVGQGRMQHASVPAGLGPGDVFGIVDSAADGSGIAQAGQEAGGASPAK